MFSKWRKKPSVVGGLTLFSLMMIVGGCRLTGEPTAKPKLPENKIGVEARCLKNALPAMRAFMQGTSALEDVLSAWSCFEGALDLFGKKVRGSRPDYYEAREVADFFEAYFLAEGVKISDSLLTEIMRLKQIFVGGENQRVTREELAGLMKFASNMRSLSADLWPHMKIISMNWQVSGENQFAGDLEKFEAAKTAAENAVERLASWIEVHRQPYRILNVAKLFRELQDLYKENWEFVATLEKDLPIVEQLKRSLMGTDPTLIEGHEWRRIGQLMVRGYNQYLRYHYFIKENPFADRDIEYRLVFKSLDDVLFVVQDFLLKKPSQKILDQEMIDLLAQIQKLLTNVKFTPEFVAQILKIKTVFLGGDEQSLSADDAERGRQKLPGYQAVVSQLVRHKDIHWGDWLPKNLPRDHARKEFRAAEIELQQIGSQLPALLSASYDLKNLKPLTDSLGQAFPSSSSLTDFCGTLKKYLPLLISGKKVLLKDSSTQIEQADWGRLFQAALPLLSRYQAYRYFLKGESVFWGVPYLDLKEWVHDLGDNLVQILSLRGRGTPAAIEIDEINSLLDGMSTVDLLPSIFPAKTMKYAVPIVLKRILTDPAERLSGQFETALGTKAIQALLREADVFFKVQNKLDSLWTQKSRWSHAELQSAFQNATGEEEELKRILASPGAFAFDDNDRMFIDVQSDLPYTQASIIRMNLMRGLVRIAIRAYAEDLARAQGLVSLTRDEVTGVMFKEVKPFLVGAGMIAENNKRFAKNRFLEANLFTPFGNGDAILDFQEFAGLSLMIWSGLNLNSQVSVSMKEKCPIDNKGDAQLFDVPCAVEQLRQKIVVLASSIPATAALFQKMSPQDGSDLLVGILTATGWEPNTMNTAEKSDLSLVPHVLQYIESIFRRWDSNKDGIIDRPEAMVAEPTFSPLLAEVSGFDDPQILKGAFAYILVYGKEPEDIGEFFDWIQKEDSWPIAVDRPQIARILGYISARVRKK